MHQIYLNNVWLYLEEKNLMTISAVGEINGLINGN